MSQISPEKERELHDRALRKDPVILIALLETFADRIAGFVRQKSARCDAETAYDAVVDVLLAYARTPERYEPHQGRLVTYLTRAVKYRVKDKLKSRDAEAEREKNHASVVELWRSSPKDHLENSVEAARVMARLENQLSGRDQAALRLLLLQERSSRVWAQTLGLDTSDEEWMQREVKRHKDRLVKILQRFGKEELDEPA